MTQATSFRGWTGHVLRVDLNTERSTSLPLDPELARDLIGGRGLNSHVLLNEIRPGTDPLGPDNVICFAPGPLSGTPLGLTSRVEVSTLSPYSGILGDGNAGGAFAFMMKRAGWDQFIITGRAESPKYLLVENHTVQVLDASDLWGRTTWEATDILKQRHGRASSVACIGQAGENLVRFASTIVDKYASAARGSGAVLGAKNLKAVVVRGNQRVPLADDSAYRVLAAEDRKYFAESDLQRDVTGRYGTHVGMVMWEPGYRNYKKYLSGDEVPEALQPEAWLQYETGRYGCHGCPVKCKDQYRIPSGRRAGEKGQAMEYECIFCLGTNCGVTDPIAIMEMENLCDAYGMDVIALGNTIAMVKDLYNRGIMTSKDTDGLDLSWEDADAQVELIHCTALRQGFGSMVAEGMYTLARRLGDEAMDYCYHVKGLSRGPYPSGLFALAHATSTRGADHLRGRSWAYGENDPDIFPKLGEQGFLPGDVDTNPVAALILGERMTTLTDCIGRCKGAVNSWICAMPLVWKHPIYDGLAKLLNTATGMDYTGEELARVADRVYAMEHAFNIRMGVTRKDDRMPQKPEIRDTPEGREDLKRHHAMVTRYYEARGYDPESGRPTSERLADLNLKYVDRLLNESGPVGQWDGPTRWDMSKYPSGGVRA